MLRILMLLGLIWLLVAVAACAIILVLGIRRISRRRRTLSRGSRLPAVIAHVKVAGADVLPVVRYVHDGREHIAEPLGARGLLSTAGPDASGGGPAAHVGRALDVRVDEGDAAVCALPGRDPAATALVVAGAVGTGLLVIAFGAVLALALFGAS